MFFEIIFGISTIRTTEKMNFSKFGSTLTGDANVGHIWHDHTDHTVFYFIFFQLFLLFENFNWLENIFIVFSFLYFGCKNCQTFLIAAQPTQIPSCSFVRTQHVRKSVENILTREKYRMKEDTSKIEPRGRTKKKKNRRRRNNTRALTHESTHIACIRTEQYGRYRIFIYRYIELGQKESIRCLVRRSYITLHAIRANIRIWCTIYCVVQFHFAHRQTPSYLEYIYICIYICTGTLDAYTRCRHCISS